MHEDCEQMEKKRAMLKSKTDRAILTEADQDYEGVRNCEKE
jgi:hypothetical protein